MTDDRRALPTQRIEHPSYVVDVVRHRERPVGAGGRQAPLLVVGHRVGRAQLVDQRRQIFAPESGATVQENDRYATGAADGAAQLHRAVVDAQLPDLHGQSLVASRAALMSGSWSGSRATVAASIGKLSALAASIVILMLAG